MRTRRFFEARAAAVVLLAMMCTAILAQTTTFKYTASEKIDRFEEISYFVGATAIQSHTYDAETQAGTVVYEGTVTEVGSYALMFQSALTSIVIPEGVTAIGYQGFFQCTNLTTIKLPKSLKQIGGVSGQAFAGCSGLANGKFIIDDIAWWCSLDIKGSGSNPIYYAKHIYSDENTEITNLVIPEGVTTIGHDAFYGCEGITSVSFPSTLESIGASAFNSCSKIASVVIPQDASIGESCFANCSGLTSVTIPEGVEAIGASAFVHTGLTSLTLPSTIRSMSQSFYGCESLTELTLKDGITTLGGSFYSCTALATVNIPGSVKEVGSSDFSGCTGLTTVTLNEGTEKVGFNGCTNLETINFPSTVKEVTITKSDKLETVTLNEGIQKINSFNYCSALKQINIPSTVTYIGTFRDCSALEKVIVADIASWCAARHYDSRFYGPQKYAGKLYLGTPASHTEITDLVIPEGVTTIKGEAFLGLPDITTITLPSTLTTIEGKVFQDCLGVTDVYSLANPVALSWSESENNFKGEKETRMHVMDVEMWTSKFPDANATFVSDMLQVNYTATGKLAISKEQFTGATALMGNFFDAETGKGYAIFSGNVTAVADNAFTDATALTSITLPEGITTIGFNAFYGCTGLTTITLPSTLTLFKDNAFAGLTHVTDVWCVAEPTTLTWNGTGFKDGKATLMHVPLKEDWEAQFPDANVTFVGDMTRFRYTAVGKEPTSFYQLDKFTGATEVVSHVFDSKTFEGTVIYKGIVTSFSDPFRYNTNLTGITVPSSVTQIKGQAFYHCNYLKTVNLPNTITSLDEYIFSDCGNLTTVNIPTSLTSLPSCMFTRCTSLTNITIPEGITTIGSYAFSDCIELTGLNIPSTVTTVYSHAFEGCTSISVVYCDADPFTEWNGNNAGFKADKATLFHVAKPDEWTAAYPDANVTFVEYMKLGDVNGDDQITAQDASLVLQHVAKKITLTGNALKAANVNGDEDITAGDASLILQYVAGKITHF